MVIASTAMANTLDAADDQLAATEGNVLLSATSLPVMGVRAERQLVDQDSPRRERVLRRLVGEAPEDPLLELAYWTAIAEEAEARMMQAGVRARAEGYTWAAIGWAYGERQMQAASRKFGPAVRGPKP